MVPPETVREAAEGLPQYAQVVFHLGPLPVTNSMLVAWVTTGVIILLVRAAVGKVRLVPHRLQNFLEFIIESLYETLETILGPHLVRKTFWFFASIFLFILIANLLSLVPLVGNATVIPATPMGSNMDVHRVSVFRAANSDLNTPLALATMYGVLWLYWSITEVGLLGFFQHIFGVKGGLTGALKWLLMPVFFAVGIIEVISILFRQVSLPLRLYGNIFAGENLLEAMNKMGQNLPGALKAIGWFFPLPFYSMEILVAVVQALVFMLLTSVFTAMMCQHEEEGHSTIKN